MKFNFVSIPRCASQTIHEIFKVGNELNHSAITKFPDRSLFSFAVIRNPVDHARSWFSFHKHKNVHLSEYKPFECYRCNFKEWVKKGFKTHWTKDDCKNHGVTHPVKQWDYVTENDKVVVDYLIKYDRLSFELFRIGKKIGITDYVLRVTSNSPKFEVEDKERQAILEFFNKDEELYRKLK